MLGCDLENDMTCLRILAATFGHESSLLVAAIKIHREETPVVS